MLSLIEYNDTKCNSFNGDFDEILPLLKIDSETDIQWLDIDINERENSDKVAKYYEIHHLTIEDIHSSEQLPKFEAFEDYYFLSIKMMRIGDNDQVIYEHLSFIVGKNYVITFQEVPGDVFENIRLSIIENKGFFRKRKSDYLFVRLVDAIVDNFGITIEQQRQHIENLENNFLKNNVFEKILTKEILLLKKEINKIRSFIIPLREILPKLRTETGHYLHKSSVAYLNDIQDHIIFQIHLFETLREMLKDLMDLYNTQRGNELNQIMKTLTVISAVFIPLTFIVGWYGMNFKFMPEFYWHYSYPILIFLMLLLSISMVIYMKLKKWF